MRVASSNKVLSAIRLSKSTPLLFCQVNQASPPRSCGVVRQRVVDIEDDDDPASGLGRRQRRLDGFGQIAGGGVGQNGSRHTMMAVGAGVRGRRQDRQHGEAKKEAPDHLGSVLN